MGRGDEYAPIDGRSICMSAITEYLAIDWVGRRSLCIGLMDLSTGYEGYV